MEDLVDDFLAFYIAGIHNMYMIKYIAYYYNITGYESTSNTLAFTIATLLQNPKMMEMYE